MLNKKLNGVLVGFSVAVLGCFAVYAQSASDFSSEEYLYHHGHSKEVIQLVNLQKARTENTELPAVSRFQPVKSFLKNVYNADLTVPLKKFGDSKITDR